MPPLLAAAPFRSLTPTGGTPSTAGSRRTVKDTCGVRIEREGAVWRMHDGDRVLTEAEWGLFAAGLDRLRDSVEEDIAAAADDTDTGVPVFDRLTPEQKIALLADTALALRDPEVPPPPHTAANEGAIMAVFSTLRTELDVELDIARTATDDRPTEIRRLLRAACDGARQEDDPAPGLHTTDKDAWDGLIEEVEGRVFWDYDFAMGDEFLDLPPDEARARLRAFGIDPDYYLAVPAEPGEHGLTAARRTLARLLGLAVPDDAGMYPSLVDLYHDLFVGPVTPEEVAAWEDHPWIEESGSPEPGWDCDFATWVAEFSRSVPTAPFQLDPVAAGVVPELPSGVRVERLGDLWAVRSEDGSYWCGLIDDRWTDAPDDEAMPALSFPSEAEARAAFAQADRMYAERAERRAAAPERLGLSE